MRKNRPGRQLFVGLMSGTSADGIDAVVAELSGGPGGLKAKVRAHVRRPFSSAFRRRVLAACLNGTVAELCGLNFVLGEQFAAAALAVIRRAGLKPAQIAAIGSHGQTVHHLPNSPTPSTLQIGEPCVIAERTGVTTVGDFRVRDVAAGGQGAPLVPFADWALFSDRHHPRIIQNIGGIGNLTFLPPRATLADVIAFDTGPGNMVLDAVVGALSRERLSYDRDGRWAGRGRVSASLLAGCLSHPFLRRRPPKTTGREEFGEGFIRPLLCSARRLRLADEDIVATVTAFTAESIADAYRRFVFPKLDRRGQARLQIILGGGGVKNPTLTRMLRERLNLSGESAARSRRAMPSPPLGPPEILTHEDFGMDNFAKEPLAFAILARATLAGQPANVPSATGARRAVVLGKVATGRPEK
jgi:anhydro-N-acetylmuramic acid kinase